MKILKFNNEDDWKAARLGKITGTRLGDVIVKRGTGPKMGFYELIAERIAIPANEEFAMDRGLRLEPEAIKRFEKETGKKVNTDLVLWVRDDNENIAISPDGYIGKTEAVEVKCLKSAIHVAALINKVVPKEYEDQVLQYFIVNDSLKTLYFVFYDPRMPKDYIHVAVKRVDHKEKIDQYLIQQKEILRQVEKYVKELTF